MTTSLFTRDRAFYRSFLRLALALMAEQAVILSVNLADNLMLGAYSESALSGVAAVNQIQFVLQQIVYGVSNGMIVLGSQYWGQRRVGEINKLAAIGALSATVLTLLLFAAVSLFPGEVLRLFTRDGDIAAQGMQYLDLMRWSYVFFGLTTVMLGAMRIAETVKIALRVSIVSLFINVGINYLLIPGRLGFPELGVRGAAIGTLTARVIEFTIVCAYLFTRDQRLQIRPRDFTRIDRQMFADYIRVSTPIIIAAAIWGVCGAVQTMILGHMDKSAIAAQSISNTLYLLMKVAAVGACSAASIIIGKAVGAGDMDQIRSYTRTLQLLFVGIGAVLAALFACIAFRLLHVYSISEATHRMARSFILIQTLTMFTMSYQMPVNSGIIRGGGDTRFMLILDIISQLVIIIPLALLAAFVWHATPVLVTFILYSDQIFKCVPAFIRVNSYKWIRRLTRPEAASDQPNAV
ncbi:MAG: MATE family efflux transporter [Clostridia bacterium]|nr:MATE family efflux transporter [Clostridia bacterium]